MKPRTTSNNVLPAEAQDKLRNTLNQLARPIRWLATHPIASLAILIVPLGMYLCALSTGQWVNRGNIGATATSQGATAAAMQTATALFLQTPATPAGILPILTPMP